jgi:uncharacterized membrane protein YeaQ/YmgE (transglycosylase-associated protein family)
MAAAEVRNLRPRETVWLPNDAVELPVAVSAGPCRRHSGAERGDKQAQTLRRSECRAEPGVNFRNWPGQLTACFCGVYQRTCANDTENRVFEVFWWFVTGTGLALIAHKALRPKDPDGPLLTVLIGIAGAELGGFLAVVTGIADFGDATAYLAASLGSVVSIGLKTWTLQL